MATAVLLVASAALTAYSSVKQGQAADQAAKHNAKISHQNAAIAKKQAAREARQIRKSNYSREASLLAKGGASGTKVNTGSLLDVLASTHSEGEIEANEATYQGELDARAYRNNASLELFKGKSAKQAGYINAGASLAGSAAGFNSAGGTASYNSFLKRTG